METKSMLANDLISTICRLPPELWEKFHPHVPNLAEIAQQMSTAEKKAIVESAKQVAEQAQAIVQAFSR